MSEKVIYHHSGVRCAQEQTHSRRPRTVLSALRQVQELRQRYPDPVTVKLNTLLLILGGLLFGVGLILGLVPMSQSGANCGSAFIASTDATVADYTNVLTGQGMSDIAGQCSDALSSRRGIALAVTIPGALLLIGGGVMKMVEVGDDVEPELVD